MKITRILIAESYNAFIKQGGGETEAESLCRYLNSIGYYCELYGPGSSSLETFQYVIYFSCHPSGLDIARACDALSIKFLLWPNFWPSTNFKSNEYNYIVEYLNMADRVIFKSETEAEIFKSYFEVRKGSILRIDWFVDQVFLDKSNPDMFRQVFGLDKFILSVGLIEPVKNQLALIKAAGKYNVPLVFVGGYRDSKYFERCRDSALVNTVFMPHLPSSSPMLVSAYGACAGYVEISHDPAGRSAIEAALQKRPLLLSKNSWTKEIFGGRAVEVEPEDEDSIANILNSMINDKDYKNEIQLDYFMKFFADNALANLTIYFRG